MNNSPTWSLWRPQAVLFRTYPECISSPNPIPNRPHLFSIRLFRITNNEYQIPNYLIPNYLSPFPFSLEIPLDEIRPNKYNSALE